MARTSELGVPTIAVAALTDPAKPSDDGDARLFAATTALLIDEDEVRSIEIDAMEAETSKGSLSELPELLPMAGGVARGCGLNMTYSYARS